jgi:hypothetical protein
LGFRGIGFSPMFALLKPTFSLPPRPRLLPLTLHPTAERSPTITIHNFGASLSPVHFTVSLPTNPGVFAVWFDLVQLSPPAPIQCSTPPGTCRRCASTHFGENQLALGSIGISPLTTAHPMIFQHHPVRPSTWLYPSFSLAMVRSPRFGSTAWDSRPLQTRFPFGSGIPALTCPTL